MQSVEAAKAYKAAKQQRLSLSKAERPRPTLH
jgi:hypothetical protein